MTDEQLRETLKIWRLETANAEGKKAFQVCTDATLDNLVRDRPVDLETLSKIGGVGAATLDRYGKAILSMINGEAVMADVDIPKKDGPPKRNLFEIAQIKHPKDLLILAEKRKSDPALSPSFAVKGRSAEIEGNGKEYYEKKLAETLTFVDSCLFTHDREGNKLGDFAQASRLKSIGVELPDRLKNYDYLPGQADFPSYWDDADNYAYLWKQKRPERDDE